jgi:hypothetical protein
MMGCIVAIMMISSATLQLVTFSFAIVLQKKEVRKTAHVDRCNVLGQLVCETVRGTHFDVFDFK